MNNEPNVAHIIVNNLGGITSLVQNLILYKGIDALPQELYLLDVKGNINTSVVDFINSNIDRKPLYFDPKSNWHFSFKQFAKQLSVRPGILVSNDQYDLIMLQAFNIPRKIVQLVHDYYNLQLSIKFNRVIDIFIAHNMDIFNKLNSEFPERSMDIFYRPYGIPVYSDIPIKKRENDILRLIYIGRHDKSKGVYSLYEINKLLKEKNIEVGWTILGKGPETEHLKKQWEYESNIDFYLAKDEKDVLAYASKNDILVFPTSFEGSPVALLEAMSMGCVSIVTNLSGGISETIKDGVNGFKCTLGKIQEFSDSIEKLHYDRVLLKKMQDESKKTILSKYNVLPCSVSYQDLFKKLLFEKPEPRHHKVSMKIGSRLDNPLIPNFITRSLRLI